MKTSYETDNRFVRQGWAPEEALAVYGARWIDMGEWGDILPDRQGMAYDSTEDRDVLSSIMNEAKFWNPLPAFRGTEALGTLVHEGRVAHYKMWRPTPYDKGYIYVEAWLNAED